MLQAVGLAGEQSTMGRVKYFYNSMIPLPKPIQKWFKIPVENSERLWIEQFSGEDDGHGYRNISGFHSSSTPGVFYECFYNHAHRLRLEKLLYTGLSRSSNGYFKPLLDPGGGFRSETAVTKPFQK